VAAIEQAGGQALAVQADVSQAADVHQLFTTAIARFGRVDVLVNNAGIMKLSLLKDTTDEDLQRTLAINVTGVFNTLREAATQLADGGNSINFSSSVTRLMLPTYAAYCASKGACGATDPRVCQGDGRPGHTRQQHLAWPRQIRSYSPKASRRR